MTQDDDGHARHPLEPEGQPPDGLPGSSQGSGAPDAFEDELVQQEYEQLMTLVRDRLPAADVRRIERAFQVASEAHRGRFRDDKRPEISHPLAVATILAEMGFDDVSVIAGLLHDTVEDSSLTLESIAHEFGQDVAAIVEGVTKLERLSPVVQSGSDALAEAGRRGERRQAWAANVRHLLASMARDVRVIIVKLADRLHNMRTLAAKAPADRLRIARETADVYAPLAHRLGMWQMKAELEDLAFRYMEPAAYQQVVALVDQTRASRNQEVQDAIAILREHLRRRGLPHAVVEGRAKHYYSIYRKMETQGLRIADIYDIVAVRIIVSTRDQCYQALGLVHELWQPVPNQFADYIALPKANGYQSLHLKVVGPQGHPIEVQIRTWQMHRQAEFGAAAHWAYKEKGEEGTTAAEDRWIAGIRKRFFEAQPDEPSQHLSDRDFWGRMSELLKDQVVVFTPKGHLYELPVGATIIDFAYLIHTDIGHHAVGARVNGAFTGLDYECQNGDTIEVLTRANSAPGHDWLQLAKTRHARAKIKAYFRKANMETNIARGRSLLASEAARLNIDAQKIKDEALREICPKFNVPGVRELLAGIGAATISVQSVLRALVPQPETPRRKGKSSAAGDSRTDGTQGVLRGMPDVKFHRARCCLPLPGEPVCGYLSHAHDLRLHRATCPNVTHYLQKEPERILTDLTYEPQPGRRLPVRLQLTVDDRTGILAEAAAIMAERGINISSSHSRKLRHGQAIVDFVFAVHSVEECNAVIEALTAHPDFTEVRRVGAGKDMPCEP